MVPPINSFPLKRNLGTRSDSRNIYYLTDGTVTEQKYFVELFNNVDAIKNRNVRLIKCEKSGDDEGVSDLLSLIKLAKKHIETNKSFKKGFDKILIISDLDVFNSNHLDVEKAIIENPDIIFAYSNPAFELFILLSLGDFNKVSREDKGRIILNEYVNGERFIYHYLKTNFGFDTKDNVSNFNKVAKNFANAKEQESTHLNQFIDKSKDTLTSNIGYVISKIDNNDFNFQYFSEDFDLNSLKKK